MLRSPASGWSTALRRGMQSFVRDVQIVVGAEVVADWSGVMAREVREL